MKENQLDYTFVLLGGMLDYCFAICDQIKCSITPIWIYASGMADSCGFLILICGDRRMVYENTQLMYHQLSWGNGYGKVRSIDETNEQIKKDQEKLDKIVVSNTKITKEKLEYINERKIDWYITPEEALNLGVIDEIMKTKKKKRKK